MFLALHEVPVRGVIRRERLGFEHRVQADELGLPCVAFDRGLASRPQVDTVPVDQWRFQREARRLSDAKFLVECADLELIVTGQHCHQQGVLGREVMQQASQGQVARVGHVLHRQRPV